MLAVFAIVTSELPRDQEFDKHHHMPSQKENKVFCLHHFVNKQLILCLLLFTEFFTVIENHFGPKTNVLDAKGFRYCHARTAKRSGIEIWRCSKRTRGHCKAGIHILGANIIHHFEEEHNHDPEFQNLQCTCVKIQTFIRNSLIFAFFFAYLATQIWVQIFIQLYKQIVYFFMINCRPQKFQYCNWKYIRRPFWLSVHISSF